MTITLDGTLGITTPAETVQGALTTTGNTILGDATTDTLTVGVTGIVKDASGNVGIGTSSPGAILHTSISGSGEVGRFATTTNSTPFISIYSNGSIRAKLRASTAETALLSQGALPLLFGTNDTEQMRITSTGNVTVGTDDLGYKLGVFSTSTGTPALNLRSSAAGDAGTAQLRIIKLTATSTTSQIFIQFVIDGNNINSGQINANGASAAAFGSFSDIRLKENIVDLPSQLANIMALRPVEFDYIESEGGGHQIGFIAQEVQQVYPDLIGEREGGMLTLTDLNKNDARLIKAIQELKAIVDAQAVRIAALEA
jgi:hypothetical protein